MTLTCPPVAIFGGYENQFSRFKDQISRLSRLKNNTYDWEKKINYTPVTKRIIRITSLL
jgi:hypothetical protein